MARRLRLESEAGVYHVINRGNYRSPIFRAERTKQAFLRDERVERGSLGEDAGGTAANGGQDAGRGFRRLVRGGMEGEYRHRVAAHDHGDQRLDNTGTLHGHKWRFGERLREAVAARKSKK
jgi:hypothetical protein